MKHAMTSAEWLRAEEQTKSLCVLKEGPLCSKGAKDSRPWPRLTGQCEAKTDPNPIVLENKYTSLLSMVDAVYPPLLCTLCDTISPNRQQSNDHYKSQHKSTPRYLCIHPHCELQFRTRAALRFHLAHAHLIRYSSKPLPDPSILHYTTAPPSGTFPSHCSRSPEVTTTTATASPSLSPFSPPSPPPLSPLRRPSVVFKMRPSTTRAPKGSKKIVLSPSTEELLNSVYHPLQCPSCHDYFNRKTNVIKHLTDEHHGEEPYRCVFQDCMHPRQYATREGLVYHILHVHDTDLVDNSSSCSDQPATEEDDFRNTKGGRRRSSSVESKNLTRRQ